MVQDILVQEEHHGHEVRPRRHSRHRPHLEQRFGLGVSGVAVSGVGCVVTRRALVFIVTTFIQLGGLTHLKRAIVIFIEP